MTIPVDNRSEPDYSGKVRAISERLRSWSGPIVLATHIDPDGDAVGSTLALSRALQALGRATTVSLIPPRFLTFLTAPGEVVPQLETLAPGTLLVALDAGAASRVAGVPLGDAALTINIDHHGTNDRFGDIHLVDPGKAATAQIVKDIVEQLGLAWTPELATPCLLGILTDTGFLRFGNTRPAVLRAAAELLASGLDYAELTDRLQWRPQSYYPLLAQVMATVEFPLGGEVALARVTESMREDLSEEILDSEDFIGVIRYAEGIRVAVLLKEQGDTTKVSVRTRGGVSAQAICLMLGGGGHVPAAGATIAAAIDIARERVLTAVRKELERTDRRGSTEPRR